MSRKKVQRLDKTGQGINKKVDVAQALKLRMVNKLSYEEIGKIFGVTKGAIHKSLQSFISIIDDPDASEAFKATRSEILTSIERQLANQLVNPDKLKDASLNNVAYAYDKVATHNRLEQGKATQLTGIYAVVQRLDRDERKATEEAIDV